MSPKPSRTLQTSPALGSARDHAAWLTEELLGDFPFVDEPSRAHALGALLTPLVRPMFSGPSPLFLIDAPTPGSGKSLLADVVHRLALGRPSAPIPLPRSEAETRKSLLALLIDGVRVVVFDNVNHVVKSESLASMLTQERFQGRLLGQSATASPSNTTTWLLTGNNAELSGELWRRTLTIRLDPRVERPWERCGFHHPDLVGWVDRQRVQIVRRLLAMAQAWVRAGRPQPAKSMASFGGFSEVVGGILAHAGIEGFLVRKVKPVADPEETEWQRLAVLWHEHYGTEWVHAGALLELAANHHLLGVDEVDNRSRTRFGRALSKQRDRVFVGFRVEVSTDRATRQNRYRLQPTSPASPGSPVGGAG